MADNRYVRARSLAGLSPGQAARLLDVPVADLQALEHAQQPRGGLTVQRLAEIYGCSVEWLTSQVPRLDYGALNRIPGSEDLAFCDRDAIAEILAARPRRFS